MQVLSTHLAKNEMASPAHEAMKPFLKVIRETFFFFIFGHTKIITYQIVLEMILSQQVSSDLLNVASGTFYALICAYQVNIVV